MPGPKRPRRAQTDDWEQLRLFVGWPEQETYEMLRPIVLFGQTSEKRAQAVGVSERTLDRKAARFDAEGMASLFDDDRRSPGDKRLLSADIRITARPPAPSGCGWPSPGRGTRRTS